MLCYFLTIFHDIYRNVPIYIRKDITLTLRSSEEGRLDIGQIYVDM